MSPDDIPVPLRIARQADRTPDATAVIAPDGELTYRLLDRRARAVAGELRAAGAGPEDTVLVGVGRGADWAVALLGVWYAGAAPLLVDPAAPDERLRSLLAAAGTRHAVVTGHAAAARLHRRCDQELFWAATRGDAPGADPDAVSRGADPEPAAVAPGSLAYVLFTSGSTGRPKPVAVAHAGLARQTGVLAERYGLTAADRVLQFAAPAFDVALEEALPTWCTGGTAVFVDDNLVSPAELEPFLIERAVTLVNLPTPYWSQWAKDVERRPRPLPPALRHVVIGSDVGRTADLVRWHAAGGPPVTSAYGLTESTITATCHEAHAATLADAADEVIPLGVPLPGVRAYVLDEGLRPTADGEAGELYLAGSCLARGYHDRPALTAERFVADPFAAGPGERMYRTGDRVRRAPDGTLRFLGRTDDQVKIRGHRVELKEVEAAIAAHPDVVDVVVRAVRQGGEPQLAAWIEAAPGRLLDGGELRRHVAARAPGHLVPARVRVLPRLPRTPGGKLDVRALPDPFHRAAAVVEPPLPEPV
ncbi:amino acid adenylation domain-containing protein [Streptomyces sp. NPDC102395]|uniref:amino acid adenylation domain-containing protein n=1 Tax=Streptomyces sp. NPDC102395 TaxID=3366168 RepID=UPI0038212268